MIEPTSDQQIIQIENQPEQKREISMSKQIIAIYDRTLKKNELARIGRLCPGVKIEELDENYNEAVACAFLQEFGYGTEHKCYVFHDDQVQAKIFLALDPPDYLGRWDDDAAEQCDQLGSLFENTRNTLRDIEGLDGRAIDHNGAIMEVFGTQGSIDVKMAEALEAQLLTDFEKIEEALEAFFHDRKLS